jgi:hypothetical protein
MGNPIAKELGMVALECSQIILEIEKLVKERFKLKEIGFTIIFYKINERSIGFKVITEKKKQVNLENDTFAFIDRNEEVVSAYSEKIDIFIQEYFKLKNTIFNELAIEQKVIRLADALNYSYQSVANIPLKLQGFS